MIEPAVPFTSQREDGQRPPSPFPGLRSFTGDESDLFFGRDGQSNAIAHLLELSGFVAVVGTSGCGKSSLVHAGLLPTLLAGYASRAGSKWRLADLRPGTDPLGALASAMPIAGSSDPIDAVGLRAASTALVESVQAARKAGHLAADESLLILVDQFEELFRDDTPQDQEARGESDDKAHFVALLLAAARATQTERIFVAITLRAEFLGDCARFRDLPAAINASQYLVPRMTRQQRRAAIEGPIRVAGASIAPRLVQRLLNELGEDPDELPVLQHALLRTWEKWIGRGKPETEIDFDDYEATGTFTEALDNHADEALEEAVRRLGEGGETLVKRIFQRLRIRDAEGRETRSPSSVGQLCAVTGADFEGVRMAVDCFRDDHAGWTFLTPFKSVVADLQDHTEIDVTHESLLRRWEKLRQWVIEEEESRRFYMRLVESGEEEGADQNLLRGSWLERYHEWWNERHPNPAWGARYDPNFSAAEDYLAKSWAQLQRDKEEQERTRLAEEKRALDEARRQAEAQAKIAEEQAKSAQASAIAAAAQAKAQRAQLGRKNIAVVAAVSCIGLIAAVILGYKAREAGQDALNAGKRAIDAQQEAVAEALASQGALAATGDGPGAVTGLLLAAESLWRRNTRAAGKVVSDSLALLPSPQTNLPAIAADQVAVGDDGKWLGVLNSSCLSIYPRDAQPQNSPAERLVGITSFSLAGNAPIAVAAGSDLIVLDMATGKRFSFPCPGPATTTAVSSNGLVAAALCGGNLHVWKAAPLGSWRTARELRTRGVDGPYSMLALDNDGETLALYDADSPKHELDLAWRPSITLLGPINRVTARLASDSIGTQSDLQVTAITLRKDELVVGDSSGRLRIWQLDRLRSKSKGSLPEPGITFAHSAAVTVLSSDLSGKMLIAGYRDGVAQVWDPETNRPRARLVANSSITSVAISSARQEAFTAEKDRVLRGWDLAGVAGSMHLGYHALVAQFSAPLHWAFIIKAPFSAQVVDIDQRKFVADWTFPAPELPVGISPTGTAVAIHSSSPAASIPTLTLRKVSVDKVGAPLWPVPVPQEGLSGLPAFSLDGEHLAGYLRARSNEAAVKRPGLFVWNAATGAEELYRAAEPAQRSLAPVFSFTPDSKDLLFAWKADRLRKLSIATRREDEVAGALEGGITAVTVSPDGRLLATATSSLLPTARNQSEPLASRIHVRSYPEGKELDSFEQPGQVRKLIFDSHSRYLLSSAQDGSFFVWSAASSRPEAALSFTSPPLTVAFTGDASRVVAVERDRISFSPWRREDLIQEACRRAGRDLTDEEWKVTEIHEARPSTCRDHARTITRNAS